MAFSTFLGGHPANLALAMCKQVALQDLDVTTGHHRSGSVES